MGAPRRKVYRKKWSKMDQGQGLSPVCSTSPSGPTNLDQTWPAGPKDSDQWETSSIHSQSSKLSRRSRMSTFSSSSASSMSSASSFLYDGLKAFGRTFSSSTSRASAESFAPGVRIRSVATVTMREGENLDTAEVQDFGPDTIFTVISVSCVSDRRIHVRTEDSNVGWISCKTVKNEPLVQEISFFETLSAGQKCIAKESIIVHSEPSRDGEKMARMKPGTAFEIKAVGKKGTWVQIVTSEVAGWVNILSSRGKPRADLHEGADDCDVIDEKESGIVLATRYQKTKTLLQLAASGDLHGVKSLVESRGFFRSSSERPNLNGADIRGTTCLMYAAGLGHKPVVEYFLTKKEVDVNITDDTRKTALHYASKRGSTRRPSEQSMEQSEIVCMLLWKRANLQAKDYVGRTALMFSIANGDEAVARRLMLAFAEINTQDYEGHTPLDYALTFNQCKLVDRLKHCGGLSTSTEIQDTAGQDAIDKSDVGIEINDSDPNEQDKDGAEEVGEDVEKASKTRRVRRVVVKKRKASSSPSDAADGETAADSADPVEAQQEKAKPKRRLVRVQGKSKNRPSPAMLGAVEDLQVLPDMGLLPSGEEYQISDDPKEMALSKVKALLQGSSALELELAIKSAHAKGASVQELTEANRRLSELTLREKLLQRLQQAVTDRDIATLRSAVVEASEAGLTGSVFENAQAILVEEEPKVEALQKLEVAKLSADVENLRVALAHAKDVGVSTMELAEYETLLLSAKSKENSISVLQKAMQDKDVDSLKFAIKQAKSVGVDADVIKQAKAVLKVEEPKAKCRVMLREAMGAMTTAALRAALTAAAEAKIEREELTVQARQLLEDVLRREEAKAALQSTMQKLDDVDFKCIDDLRAGKEQLSRDIESALRCGVQETSVQEAEALRKKMHNAIEDLKGSVRVFCRVRPLSERERETDDAKVMKSTGLMTVELESQELESHGTFEFDAVFDPGTQDEIFQDCRDLIQSAIDGYNVTIFAYGQTGAGKTHTLYGIPRDEGIAPRTIKELFRILTSAKDRYKHTIMASMLELYKNDFVDLLTKQDLAQERPTSPQAAAPSRGTLKARVDRAGNIVVDNLTVVECGSSEELLRLLDQGAKQRSVAATAMNSESSRSHLVLTINIVSVNYETDEQIQGKIVICDLAGSERLKKSLADGDNQKESIEINKSLTALGDVIGALTQKKKQIPYRNHRLTQLLQDALGGTAKTLMFVNCSPADSNASETLTSLKYAARAKQIVNGVVKNST